MAKKQLADLDFGGAYLPKNLPSPVNSGDALSLGYAQSNFAVDSTTQIIDRLVYVDTATTAVLTGTFTASGSNTLTWTASAPTSINGVALNTTDNGGLGTYVLIKNQTGTTANSGAQINGVYRVTATGTGTMTMVRVSEMDTASEIITKSVIVKNNASISVGNICNSVWTFTSTFGASTAFVLAPNMGVVSSANNGITFTQQFVGIGTGLQISSGLLSIIQATANGTTYTNTQTPTLAYLATIQKRYARAVTGGAVTLVEGECFSNEIQFTGTLTSNSTILTTASITYNKILVVTNSTSGAFTLTFNGVSIPQGQTVILMLNGIQTAYQVDIRANTRSKAVTGGAVTLSFDETLADSLTFTGTLTSNSTVTPQSFSGYRYITNSTTGAFTLTVGGLLIPQGSTVKVLQSGTTCTFLKSTLDTLAGTSDVFAIVSNETEFVTAMTSASIKTVILASDIILTATSATIAMGCDKNFPMTGYSVTLGNQTHNWSGGFNLKFIARLKAGGTSTVLNLTGALYVCVYDSGGFSGTSLQPSATSAYESIVGGAGITGNANLSQSWWYTAQQASSSSTAPSSDKAVSGAWSGGTDYEFTVTVAGAVVGDGIVVTPNSQLYGSINTAGTNPHIYASVSATDTVKVTFRVDTYVTLASSSAFNVKVIK